MEKETKDYCIITASYSRVISMTEKEFRRLKKDLPSWVRIAECEY